MRVDRGRRWCWSRSLAAGVTLLAACSSGSSSPTTTGSTNPATVSTTTGRVRRPRRPPGSHDNVGGRLRPCATAALSGIGRREQRGGRHHRDHRGPQEHGHRPPASWAATPGSAPRPQAGRALPTKVVRKGSYSFTAMAPTTVTLAPGASVYFNIGYSDVPVGSETCCPSSAVTRGHPAQRLRPPGGGGHVGPVWGWEHGGVAGLLGHRAPARQTTAPPGG